MRSQSKKRRAEQDLRLACAKAVYLRDRGTCQGAHLIGGACSESATAHEVVQRSVRPGSHLEPDLCIWICHTHHMWVHDNVGPAHELGLLRHSWDVDEHGQLKPMEDAA